MVSAVAVSLAGCATLQSLGALVQPPTFAQADDRPADVRLLPPSTDHALGAATVRIWTKVANPNRFGFTLSSLDGTLYLDDARAATSALPLGLPLAAGAEAVVPIDLSIDFADLPGLSNVVQRVLAHEPVAFHLDGTVGVDAGRYGMPRFGPMRLLSGSIP